jgi:predicted DNA-binding transcriptional regulator AlpA
MTTVSPLTNRTSRSSRRSLPVATAVTPIRAHLTIADLCAELGVARSTFYDWRAAKKAPRCIKLPNGDIRIRRTDFENWLESLEDAA